MDLYLVPNNLENSHLVSANGVSHYRILSEHSLDGTGPRVTVIYRPGTDMVGASVVAEIEWKTKYTPTVIRSHLVRAAGQHGDNGAGVRALDYLYKRHRFKPSRYFIGDDTAVYRWKMHRGVGCKLTHSDTHAEVASSLSMLSAEGIFAGEKKYTLRIQPCSVDIDLIVLTFVIMEWKRRERYGSGEYEYPVDEDPQGECDATEGGDGDGDGGGEGDSGLVGEL